MTQDSRNDPDNWEPLQALFHLAEATPSEDRERVLAEHCSDPDLLRRALAIFAAAQTSNPAQASTSQLNQTGQPVFFSLTGDRVNSRIGPYTLIRHLGSGGLGSVYLVERLVGSVVQRSALKVMAPHAVGPSFIDRFHREQHILASLDHPNITRMLDAGLSETGQPYLVMEYVDGLHFDAYCDQHRLGLGERLALFLYVCDAVAYAHRNLIVHLDLKPSNILVTEDGKAKLLDFGTSKLLRTGSDFTTTILATPAYASPEQLRNEAITTACDVYALGAILFEMLTGHRPGGSSSVAIMLERARREQAPDHLSEVLTDSAAEQRGLTQKKLSQALAGDLDTIASKCLAPRPLDRYVSVDALAEDIRRFNEGRPILARRQSTMYKAGKFLRRHRSAVAATLLVAFALLATLGYAESRQRQALREGQRALRMQTFMYRLFKLANSSYTGKPASTVPEFLELGVKLLPDYIKEPADLREAQLSLAESMFDNGDLKNAQAAFMQTIASARAAGDIQSQAEASAFAGNIAYQLGEMKDGEKLTADALQLSKASGVSPSVRVWSEIYYAYDRENSGFASDANLKLLQDAVAESTKYNLPERETAFAMYMLASDYEVRGQLPQAQQLIQRAIAIYNSEPYAICDQSEMYADLAYIQAAGGDAQGSIPLYQKAYEGDKTCLGMGNRSTLVVLDFMAGAMTQVGQGKQAASLLEAAMPAWRKTAGGSPDMANPLHFLTSAYISTGDFARAEATAEEEFKAQDGKIKPDDHRIGVTQLGWARALAGEHKYKEALPHAQSADTILAHFQNSTAQKATAVAAHKLVQDMQAQLLHNS